MNATKLTSRARDLTSQLAASLAAIEGEPPRAGWRHRARVEIDMLLRNPQRYTRHLRRVRLVETHER